MAMSKGELTSLRTLVRQRIRVLRADVNQREAELQAELNASVKAQLSGEDALWEQVAHGLQEVRLEANRQANDVMRKVLGDRWKHERALATVAEVSQVRAADMRDNGAEVDTRANLLREGLANIRAKVKAAERRLEQVENELLTELTIGGLESDEARAFLARIPTVGELVPADRLRELTA